MWVSNKDFIEQILDKYITDIKNATYESIICEHVWWTAIYDSVEGKWDIDIQIRVPQDQCNMVITALKSLYDIKRPELWSDTFAIFKAEEEDSSGEIIPIDMIVVAIGSDYDYFHLIRDAINTDKQLLNEYNAIKLAHNPKNIVYGSQEYQKYSLAKQALYKKIFAKNFNKIFS